MFRRSFSMAVGLVLLSVFSVTVTVVACDFVGPSLGNTVVHQGDLVIQGTETFIMDGCTYNQTGNIYVRDYGRLVIRNSTLILNQECDNQWVVWIDQQASVFLSDVILDSQYRFPIQFGQLHEIGQNPKGYFENVTIEVYCYIGVQSGGELIVEKSNLSHIRGGYEGSKVHVTDSVIGDLRFFKNADLFVQDSRILSLWPYLYPDPQPTSTFHFVGLKPGLYAQWYFGEPYNVTLSNTTVEAWVPYVPARSWVTFEDSQLDVMTLMFREDWTAIVSDLRPMYNSYYEYWDLHQAQETNADYGLTLINTTVRTWWVIGFNQANITIRDSEIQWVASTDHCMIYLVNSTAEGVSCRDRGNINVSNSRITSTLTFGPGHEAQFEGEGRFEETALQPMYDQVEIGFDLAHVYLAGSIEFVDAFVNRWYKSTVTRDYGLVVRDASGHPLQGAEIRLFGRDNSTLWNGRTDVNGEAMFNATYVDGNHTDTLKLDVRKGNQYVTKNVTFLTSTPIEIRLGNMLSVTVIRNNKSVISTMKVFDETGLMVSTAEGAESQQWGLPDGTYYVQASILHDGFVYTSTPSKVVLIQDTEVAISFMFGNLTVTCLDINREPLGNCTLLLSRENQQYSGQTDASGCFTRDLFYGNWTVKALWMNAPVGEAKIEVNATKTTFDAVLDVGDLVVKVIDQYGNKYSAEVALVNDTYGLTLLGDAHNQIPLVEYRVNMTFEAGTQTYTMDAKRTREVQIEVVPMSQKLLFIGAGVGVGMLLSFIVVRILTRRTEGKA